MADMPGDLRFRALRATAMTEMGGAGVGVIAFGAHSGHLTPQMVRRDQRRTTEQCVAAARQRQEHPQARDSAASWR